MFKFARSSMVRDHGRVVGPWTTQCVTPNLAGLSSLLNLNELLRWIMYPTCCFLIVGLGFCGSFVRISYLQFCGVSRTLTVHGISWFLTGGWYKVPCSVVEVVYWKARGECTAWFYTTESISSQSWLQVSWFLLSTQTSVLVRLNQQT